MTDETKDAIETKRKNSILFSSLSIYLSIFVYNAKMFFSHSAMVT